MSNYPENYEWLSTKFKDAYETHQKLGVQLQSVGPLDKKSIHLIQIAGAAAIRSEGGVHSHVRRALEEKISADEIYHALVLLTSTIGFPSVAAALSWARDIIEGQ